MVGRYDVAYISPGGREWRLTDSEWVAGIKSGGVDGLVGDVQDVVQSPVGSDSQVLEYQSPRPMDGSLTLHIRGDEDRSADDVWADLRKDFSRSKRGVLRISSPAGTVSCHVRLSSPLGAPTQDPAFDEVVLDVQVSLVADRAGWWFPAMSSAQSGVVTVTNSGDLTIFPTIRWRTAGQFIVPSGAKFTLPAVATDRIAYLSHGGVGRVEDTNGVADKATRSLLATLPSEGVPAGETRTYTIPANSVLSWQVGVLDPWL